MRPRFAILLLAGCGVACAAMPAEPVAYPELRFHAPPRTLANGATTEEWPHFLGPHRNATTGEKPLLARWPADGPRIVWEMAKGEGYAGPVIAGGRLVCFHRVGGKETLDCLDPETGRRFWRFDYPVAYEDRYGFSAGPRASAVIAGGCVYAAGVTAMMHCLDLETGRVIWRRDLMAEYRIPQYFFGYGPTPCVWRDLVIITVGGKAKGASGTCVAALDRLTGRTVWEVDDAWGADYASPIVATLGGREVALVMTGGESRPSQGGLLTLDPRTGEVLDRFPWRAKAYESATAATPLVIGDRRVLISECYEKGGTVLEFDRQLKTRQVWTERAFGLHWMMPLLIDGHLYGFAGRNPPDTEFRCVNVDTGKIVWSDDTRWTENGRVSSFFRASLLRAGERVFCLGEDGVLGEFELSPGGLVIRQRVRLFAAQSTWTLPTLHRGLLYVAQNERDLRSGKLPRIICYDLRGQ